MPNTPTLNVDTIRYERGAPTDVKNRTHTNTGTYVIIRRSASGDTVTAYERDGRVHWNSRWLEPGEEAKFLGTGMWYDNAQQLPEGF